MWGFLGLQGLVLLGLYLLGATAALVAASVLSRTIGRGETLPFYLELPPYRVPPARLLAAQVWGAARAFLRRAGTIILGVSIVLWVLLSFRTRRRRAYGAGATPRSSTARRVASGTRSSPRSRRSASTGRSASASCDLAARR